MPETVTISDWYNTPTDDTRNTDEDATVHFSAYSSINTEYFYRYCPKCGWIWANRLWEYCPYCGSKLDEDC